MNEVPSLKLRPMVTCCTVFSFLVIALTGIFMFFHVSPWGSMGIWKGLHEWGSMLFLLSALIHIAYNFRPLLRLFTRGAGRWSWVAALSICAVVVALILLAPKEEHERRGGPDGQPGQGMMHRNGPGHAPDQDMD